MVRTRAGCEPAGCDRLPPRCGEGCTGYVVVGMGRNVDVDDLVGATEIAERTGLTNGRVHAWHRHKPDFPAPVATLRGALIWAWPDVEAWLVATGRVPAVDHLPQRGQRRR